MYHIERVQTPAGGNGQQRDVLLSPHLYGWPMMRPRLYTILVHKKKASLSKFSETMRALFKRPVLHVRDLFVAPKARLSSALPKVK